MQGNGRYSRFETTKWGDINVGGSDTTPPSSGNVILSGTNNFITNGTYNTIVGGKDGIISATGTSNAILCGTGNEIKGTCSSCSITGGDDNIINNCSKSNVIAGSNNNIQANGAIAAGVGHSIDARATNSFAVGEGALLSNPNEFQIANGYFFASGDAHYSIYVLRTQVVAATTTTLYLDYPTNTREIYISNNTFAGVTYDLVSTSLNGTGGSLLQNSLAIRHTAAAIAYTANPTVVTTLGSNNISSVNFSVTGNTLRIQIVTATATQTRMCMSLRLTSMRHI